MNSSSLPLPPANAGGPIAIPRQQVSIERLPTRRQSNEPRESMNCKSCRKRKIKCNRMRPSCEACQVFQCPCIYDAVPKKRGPKTDVLEALLKRVDGLEAKLKEKNAEGESSKLGESALTEADDDDDTDAGEPAPKRLATEASKSSDEEGLKIVTDIKPTSRDNPASPVETDAYLHTYFARFHGKPYYILDESSIRQRIQLNQLPDSLAYAIWSVASRHTPHPRGPQAAVQLSEDYAQRARRCIDTDDPSIDCLQGLLLLVMAFMASGHGKKAYMLMSSAIGMAMALELHREIDAQAHVTPVERELRRRLFWTCYLLDRYLSCGSKRSSLIGDNSIALRLPSWCPTPSSLPVDGEFFQQGSNLQYYQGSGKKSQGSTGMLIDITRILGITNRYLAAGGVKGDSHFPWHSLSTLSKIRQELDFWASGAGPVFSGLQALFHQTEATIVFLSKLIYHLIHCLVYRPFLPIDLAELAGNGQHQSWQIEATNMCFLHANAIGELIDAARQAGTVEWPAIVGYCICTAATVHIHGAHYTNPGAHGGDVSVFSASSDLLSREMQQLSALHFAWANVQHQSDTLQGIYNAHGELVKAMVASSMRYTPGFHLEDFFDRYSNIGGPGGKSYRFDPAHLSMSDIVIDFTADRYSESPAAREAERYSHKRKNTSSHKKRNDARNSTVQDQAVSTNQQPGAGNGHYQMNMMQPPSHAATGSMQPQASRPPDAQHVQSGSAQLEPAPTIHAYNMPPVGSAQNSGQGMMQMGGTGFSPAYSYATGPNVTNNQNNMGEANVGFDPMFGTLPTNAFSSPAGWHGEDGQHHTKMNVPTSGVAPSPGTKSTSGSTGTGHSDEKDPFLSLLEQLAEDEQRFNGGGPDLDSFFLAGNNTGA
ncbi:fungal specific transcription factor [Pochonia chlamydosporia 170]|uniref:Fungal specific transcription factor n=1 Tax=Pochonia chlamydosporia 170 TaxID=1380566 RepID=A0A179FLB3_METCM|nr:fungal specific transcription factor [Pochonia chlamydosporia 170]OAQ65789.2 fungal specific transcription factor [Pochonia chlamydosporia 170]